MHFTYTCTWLCKIELTILLILLPLIAIYLSIRLHSFSMIQFCPKSGRKRSNGNSLKKQPNVRSSSSFPLLKQLECSHLRRWITQKSFKSFNIRSSNGRILVDSLLLSLPFSSIPLQCKILKYTFIFSITLH